MDRIMPLVPGANANPMHLTGVRTTNNCRTKSTDKVRIRVRQDVRPTGGRIDLDMTRAASKPRRPRKVKRTSAFKPAPGTVWSAWA